MCSCSIGEGGRDRARGARAQWPFLMAWGQPPTPPPHGAAEGLGSGAKRLGQSLQEFTAASWDPLGQLAGSSAGVGCGWRPPLAGLGVWQLLPELAALWGCGAGSGGVAVPQGCLLQPRHLAGPQREEAGGRIALPAHPGFGAVPPARGSGARCGAAGKGPGPALSPRRGRSSSTQWLRLSSAPGSWGSPSPLLPWFSSGGFQAFFKFFFLVSIPGWRGWIPWGALAAGVAAPRCAAPRREATKSKCLQPGLEGAKPNGSSLLNHLKAEARPWVLPLLSSPCRCAVCPPAPALARSPTIGRCSEEPNRGGWAGM